MKRTAGIHTWLRMTIVICTTFGSVVTAAAPASGQQHLDQLPQALFVRKIPEVVEIHAGQLPGRKVDGVEIDVTGCVQTVLSRTLVTANLSEARIGTREIIKPGAFLCGDGVAINKQIIIEGTTSELDKLQQKENNSGVKLTTELVKPNRANKEAKGINLYTITDGASVVDKVKTINLDVSRNKHINVVATPNYETASKATLLYRGSPSIGGSPSNEKGQGRTEAEFKKQWIWKSIDKPVASSTQLTGKGVIVGIFDSFCTAGRYPADYGTLVSMSRLAVIGNQAETDPDTGRRIENVCAHGEFVWSLSHELAPRAQYFLYPVLDEYGLGDVATLIKALEQFSVTAQSLNKGKDLRGLQGVVINLSLTVNSIQGDIVSPLQTEIENLVDMGATVVAAAGNDSGDGIQPMRPPAAFSDVIGVAAVQTDTHRASYSNWVPAGSIDVAAPGGDGDCSAYTGEPSCVIGKDVLATKCVSGAFNKKGVWICAKKVVTGYREWAGTSFATPLVSGLAALVIQKNDYRIAPMAVASELIGNVSKVSLVFPSGDGGVGQGIINVTKTIKAAP